MTLSEADIRLAYQLVLDRTASEAEVEHMFKAGHTAETLGKAFIRSAEYKRLKSGHVEHVQSPSAVLKGAIKVAAAKHVLPNMSHVSGISWPRSGHHLLVRLLGLYFGDNFGYCQFYGTDNTCCKTFPCTRTDVNLTKSHDFKLGVPLISGQKYMIQYRTFVPSMVSNFELFVRRGGKDDRASFLTFAVHEFAKYSAFVEKWVSVPMSPPQLIVRYEDLLANPLTELRRVVKYFYPNSPVNEQALSFAVATVDGQKIEANEVQKLQRIGVHKDRDVAAFRYYDEKIFSLLANLNQTRALILYVLSNTGNEPTGEKEFAELQDFLSISALEEFLAKSP